jgi:hypothetical protein
MRGEALEWRKLPVDSRCVDTLMSGMEMRRPFRGHDGDCCNRVNALRRSKVRCMSVPVSWCLSGEQTRTLDLRPASIVRLYRLRESLNDPAAILKRDPSRIRVAQID